jgi:U2 small nuclear ribonucleoprotein B''
MMPIDENMQIRNRGGGWSEKCKTKFAQKKKKKKKKKRESQKKKKKKKSRKMADAAVEKGGEKPAAAAASGPGEPSHTLYINNINDKIKREPLRRLLYELFSPHGVIIDIVNHRTVRMRGQAFVVFRDIPSAEAALAACQGRSFMDKPMRIAFARSKSSAVAKMDGTYVAKEYTVVDRAEERRERRQAKREEAARRRALGGGDGGEDDDEMSDNAAGPAAPRAGGAGGAGGGVAAEDNPPHRILFVQGLPADIERPALDMLFRRFGGFSETRLVPGKPGIAFVEFTTVPEAAAARDGLQGFKVTPTHGMVISFGRQ